jgi:hypothetical protein
MKKLTLGLMFILALFATTPSIFLSSTQASYSRDSYNPIDYRAVFALKIDGNSVCTAFAVPGPALVTAGHCAAEIEGSKVTAFNTITKVSYDVVLDNFKNKWPDDYAVFRFVKEVPDSTLKVGKAPEVGSQIYAKIGPLGIAPFLVTGIYSGVAECSDANSCSISGMMLIESAVGPGASGSPVLNSNGEVFGILVGNHPELKGMAVVSALPKL